MTKDVVRRNMPDSTTSAQSGDCRHILLPVPTTITTSRSEGLRCPIRPVPACGRECPRPLDANFGVAGSDQYWRSCS